MNDVQLMGRLTADPEVRYATTAKGEQIAVARYTLAVDRKTAKGNTDQSADFIRCQTWGKKAEFAEKYLKKGTKIAVTGRIQTGSYKNKDGITIYTTDVIVEEHFFCESKGSQSQPTQPTHPTPTEQQGGFMNIPDAISEELPFV